MIQANPFTPQSGIEPRIFSGRDAAINEFSSLLDRAKDGYPEHILVMGEWGIGKTSLLRKFKKITQSKGLWACFCGVNKVDIKEKLSNNIALITEEILLELPAAEDEVSLLRKELNLRKNSFSSVQLELARFLIAVWRYLNVHTACILLDDIQNFLPKVEIIDVLRATLSREEVIKQTRFIFVLSSTPQGWNVFLDKHDPVGRFFRRKIILEPFMPDEAKRFISEALADTGVEFTPQVSRNTYLYTQGHPYELQLLSSHLFDVQKKGVVDEISWEVALRNTLRDLGKEYFETLYSKASDREKDLLSILVEKNRPLSLAELRSIMILERKAKSFPIANIKNFIYRLLDKGLIKKSGDSSYVVLDNLFREFILRFKT